MLTYLCAPTLKISIANTNSSEGVVQGRVAKETSVAKELIIVGDCTVVCEDGLGLVACCDLLYKLIRPKNSTIVSNRLVQTAIINGASRDKLARGHDSQYACKANK